MNNIKDLHDALFYSLSDQDLKDIIGDDVRILTYEQLGEYNSLSELLPKEHDGIIILFERKEGEGHWLALLRGSKKNVLFFDSLAYRPDKQLLWNSKATNKRLGQDTPHLTYLLNEGLKEGFKISFNETKFQDEQKGFTTCGRWVSMILLYYKHNKNPTLKGFYNKIMDLSKKYELAPDLAITKFMLV